MKIGIRAHDLPGAPFENTEQLVSAARMCQVDCLQLVYKKALKDFDGNFQTLLKLSESLKKAHIEVAMIGAYFNMIHPDLTKREQGKEYFKRCLETASVFDCPLVGSETGSANGDPWIYHPENRTEESYRTVVNTVKELIQYGRNWNARPIIEGAYGHTIFSPERLGLLAEETHLQDITIDLYNYLYEGNYEERNKIFEECIRLLGKQTRVFHIKDFTVEENKLKQCAISDGIMNWDRYIKIITENCPEAVLILEGVTGRENIEKSVNYLRRTLNESAD